MKNITAIFWLLTPALSWAQENPHSNLPADVVSPVPVAEGALKVKSRNLIRGGGENGGDLEIRRIEPPIKTAAELAKAPPPVPASAESLAKFAALKAAAPTELRLFTPRVTLFGDGQTGKTLSLVQWWVTINGEYQEYEAWSIQDLSDIQVVGDLTVKRKRYILMPSVVSSSAKYLPRRNPPSAEEFTGPQSFILEKGDAGNEEGLEPFRALLESHEVNAAEIAGHFAALKQFQEEAEALAKLPKPPVNTVIQYYTTDDDAVQSGSESK